MIARGRRAPHPGHLVALVVLLAGCREPSREVPVEIALADRAYGAVGGVPGPLPVAVVGGTRVLVHHDPGPIDVWVHLPAAATLRFRVDPPVPDGAVRVSVAIDGAEHALAVAPNADGERQAAIAGTEGTLARIRLEKLTADPIAWRGARVTGVAHPTPPLLDAHARPPAAERINVIVYLVDALRADHLSLYGYPRNTSPRLAELAAHGAICRNAYAAGPATLVSIPALFTSRFPSDAGAHFMDPATTPTFAEVFTAAGYRTAAFTVNPAMFSTDGYARGFASYVHRIRTNVQKRGARAAPADEVNLRALRWIADNRDAPFLAYVHVLDVHDFFAPVGVRTPFDGDGKHPLPENAPRPKDRFALADFRAATPEGAAAGHPDRYDAGIAWVDDQIGVFAMALEQLGVARRTAILVIADHGEALGVEDDGTHGHGHSLFEEAVHIPFVLVLPWLAERRDVDGLVSLVDVAPTLADLAGVPAPEGWVGRSLFRPGDGVDPAAVLMERPETPWGDKAMIRPGLLGVAEWAVRSGPWKLLLDPTQVRLYHLPSDPKETTDVRAAHPDVAMDLTGVAWRRSPALAEGRFLSGQQPVELDDTKRRELFDALKALGYVEE